MRAFTPNDPCEIYIAGRRYYGPEIIERALTFTAGLRLSTGYSIYGC